MSIDAGMFWALAIVCAVAPYLYVINWLVKMYFDECDRDPRRHIEGEV